MRKLKVYKNLLFIISLIFYLTSCRSLDVDNIKKFNDFHLDLNLTEASSTIKGYQGEISDLQISGAKKLIEELKKEYGKLEYNKILLVIIIGDTHQYCAAEYLLVRLYKNNDVTDIYYNKKCSEAFVYSKKWKEFYDYDYIINCVKKTLTPYSMEEQYKQSDLEITLIGIDDKSTEFIYVRYPTYESVFEIKSLIKNHEIVHW